MGESIGIDSLLGGWAMPKAYSGEMRERVIAEVESGASRREAAEEFAISASTAVIWVKCFRQTGRCAAEPRGGSSTPLLAVAPRSGASLSVTRFLSKKSLRAAEQERADVARARRRWMREQGMFDPARLVFVDETAANTKMVRLSGRCPRGERLIGRVPQGHWKTITFVAALRRNGMRAPCTVDGSMNGAKFL